MPERDRTDVHVERTIELLEGEVDEVASHRDAGVEHRDVEASEHVERGVDRIGVRAWIGDVADHGDHAIAQLVDPVDRLAVDHDDRRPGRDQRFDCRLPDTGCRTGDDPHTVGVGAPVPGLP